MSVYSQHQNILPPLGYGGPEAAGMASRVPSAAASQHNASGAGQIPMPIPLRSNSAAPSVAAAAAAPQLHLTEQGYGYYAQGPNGATVFVPTGPPPQLHQQQQAQYHHMSTSMPAGSALSTAYATHNQSMATGAASASASYSNVNATNNVLAQLEREFRDIEERDPSLADGFRVVYDREVPFELRPADSRDHDVGALEGIKVKILTQGEGDSSVSAVRVELTSEADLFFHYTCLINAVGFTQLREDQKLMCEFKDFVVTLLKMCNRCIREPNNFLAVLLLNTDGSASLEFIQNVEYKFIDLLVLPFRESPDHIVRADISYRYNAVRSRLSIMTSKLQDVTALVKVRQ